MQSRVWLSLLIKLGQSFLTFEVNFIPHVFNSQLVGKPGSYGVTSTGFLSLRYTAGGVW